MLQIDHIYEFLYQELFKDFELCYIADGVPKLKDVNLHDISIFTQDEFFERKIFIFDQEPVLVELLQPYLDIFLAETLPAALATSEKSTTVTNLCEKHHLISLYYFFHGFAALDWYRGHYALNYTKNVDKIYNYDFISFNRIIENDRAYRIYFVSQLVEQNLLDNGLVSFGVTDDNVTWQEVISNPNTKMSTRARNHTNRHLTNINKLVIDYESIHGGASASIPRKVVGWMVDDKQQPDVDALWHIVTETVFYYDKLHLTEKIFKPIVSKQPFMLLAAPGNLEYLRSYGFKTFDGIIDESYDKILDHDERVEAVVNQLKWYCNLPPNEKQQVIERLAPIVEYNFQHFYGEFKHIITRELLDNCKTLFKEIGYDDQAIAYEDIYHVLTA